MKDFYQDYKTEDFITDESFIKWIKDDEPQERAFWQQWLDQHPDRQEVVAEAAQFVRLLDFEEKELPAERVSAIKKVIHSRINQPVLLPEAAGQAGSGSWFRQNWYRMAAVLTGIMLLAGVLFRLFNPTKELTTFQTAYGQTSRVVLPDSSVVDLNGHSSISYAADGWNPKEPREVYLEGEGFFSVTHKHNNQKFQVKTADDVTVEVLGTEFNISRRAARTRVVLVSGKVRLNLAPANKQVVLKPGELVEYLSPTQDFTKRKVNTLVYTSWKDDKLVFEDTPLSEIVAFIQHNYGLKVQVKDPALLKQTFTGSLPNGNVDIILASLEKAFDVNILKTRNKIVISH